MADTAKIQTRLEISGEKEYSAAIRDANRNLKTLRSELKAETAELGKNASEQEKNRVKSENLKKQIAEQEKVVAALRDALEKAKTEYGDNEEVVSKWEVKLNEARATLANMRNGLDDMSTAMQQTQQVTAESVTATKSFADAIGSIGSIGASVSGAIEGIFTSMLSTIKDSAMKVWNLIAQTASIASNYTDLGAMWGTSATEVQSWNMALSSMGMTFDDLSGIMTKIVYDGKGKDITELLGVSQNADLSNWEYAMAVLNELYDARQKGAGGAGDKYQDILTTLFGGEGANVDKLFTKWDELNKKKTEFTDQGWGMNETEIGDLTSVQEQIDTISTKWEALKSALAGGLGRITGSLLINVEGSLDAFNEYMNAENDQEREAALEKVKQNMKDFFEKLGTALGEALEVLDQVGKDLQGSDNNAIATIGTAISGIVSAMEWLAQDGNWRKGLEAFFDIWLVGKGAAMAAKLVEMVANIATIKAFSAFSGGATVATGAATTTGTSTLGAVAGFITKSIPVLAGVAELTKNLWTAQGNDDILMQDGTLNPALEGQTFSTGADGTIYYTGTDIKAPVYQDSTGGWAMGATPQEYWDMFPPPQTDDNTAPEALPETALYPIKELANELWDISMKPDSERTDDEASRATELISLIEEKLSGNDMALLDFWAKFDAMYSENSGDKYALKDLPEWWFGGTTQNKGVTSEDISALKTIPTQVGSAVSKGISGIKVTLDGRTVGNLVAPYVSQYIAAEIN